MAAIVFTFAAACTRTALLSVVSDRQQLVNRWVDRLKFSTAASLHQLTRYYQVSLAFILATWMLLIEGVTVFLPPILHLVVGKPYTPTYYSSRFRRTALGRVRLASLEPWASA